MSKEVSQMVQSATTRYTHVYILYARFDYIMQNLELVNDRETDDSVSEDYFKNVQYLCWFAFIILRFREDKYKNNLISNAYCLISALSFVLKYSHPEYDLHFKIKVNSEPTLEIIPGDKKAEMEGRIVEVVSNLMGIISDSSLDVRELVPKINTNFSETFGLRQSNSIKQISDLDEIEHLVRDLKNVCSTLIDFEGIDETIFINNPKVD